MLGPDEDTLNTCPLCHGSGQQAIGTYDIDGRPHPITNECYLCGGRGAISAGVIALWHDAGRPQVRTEE